ncbi:dipeptide transport system permease protein DppB [Pleomorphomonas sp. SM30]|uniref:Peptide/nickel transport system permease protein n=1 Tax=Oharaeibacter diazotrophicus TaxID=1920512 RepID=A0A4V3CWV2_9HYPH|nr:peptide/nickel transport system permease protein [Oharaeibacter diazotrophicus]BBE74630.1 dipeptide transport system permease protein DppB [Pleomorphomonas sp. SM30]GLS77005.1 peptide ABC transporter permease [Oharaeibacter diazotrophicus]
MTAVSGPGPDRGAGDGASPVLAAGDGWKPVLGIAAAFGRFVSTLAATLLGLLAVTFVIGRVIPIDPVLAIVGDRAPAQVYARVRAELGIDLPLWEQFWIYCTKALSGDFGTSVLTTNPVLVDIARYFPATIELATLGTLVGTLVGIPLGVYAAVRAGSLGDQIVRVLGLVGYSVPIFWLGLMGLLLFYANLDWVAGPGRLDVAYDYYVTPVTGMLLVDSLMQGQTEVFWNAVSHIVLPVALLGYFSLAYIARMTRSFMLNELSQEYVVTARVKGLSEARVIWGHALRNAAVPLVTVVVLSYATLLEGSVLTETVFAWPGLGTYITSALQSADMNAVLGGTLVIGTTFVCLNVLSDLLYRLIDPRTRR